MRKRKIGDTISAISVVLIFLIAIIAILYFISWRNNNNLQNLLANLEIKQAEKYIDEHHFFLHGKYVDEAKALIKLVQGANASIESFYKNKSPNFLPSYWSRYVSLLINKGDYRYCKLYLDYLRKKYTDSKLSDYHCVISVILNNYLSSDRCIDSIVNKEELSAYISRIRDIESRGRFDWIVDRNGAPLIYKKVGESEWEYADVSMEWLKPTMLGLKDDDYYSLIRLTIDIRVQKEAYESLGNYEGALLLMKQDGQLLAAVSKSKDNREPLFIKMLKPGSIVKIVTTSAALRNNIDLSNIFPINCKGFMVPYDKLIFYDWIEHGNVPSIVEALASSCNISFGVIGNKLGAELLKNELKEFGIGKEISLEGIRFKSGKVIDNVSDPLYNYMLSIGDTYVEVSPVLALMWASAIVNEGIAMNPYFLHEIKSINGNVYRKHNGEIYAKFTNKEYCEVIKEGMIKAVELDIGTGKRARMVNYNIALKTGTAGSKEPAYDAIVIGYAPKEQPQVAFALFALHAGKASLEGANIIKKFLESSLPIVLK